MRIGFVDEAARYIDFLTTRCLDVTAGKSLRVVYRVDGSTDLHEEILDHLEGYRGSRRSAWATGRWTSSSSTSSAS